MFERHALVLLPGMTSLRLTIAWVALIGLICPVANAAQGEGIPAGATVHIGMDSDFGADIQSELARQGVALKIVSSAAAAQLLIVVSETKDLTVTKEQRGVVVVVRRSGSVMVQDKASGSTLWSDTWRLNSYSPKDQRKAAVRVVEKLKKAVRSVRE